MFQPQYGLIKYFVGLVSGGEITNFAMLNNPKTALLGIGIAALWKQIPLTTLLLLAGLQNVPDDMLRQLLLMVQERRDDSLTLYYLI